jgi:DNA-binding CsgD family transcriptional regulator
VALGIVFGLEILTPNDALLALGLPPLLAAMWVLSGRFTAVVSGLALVLFGIVLFAEATNRLTIVSIGAAALILAAAVRLYATSLSDVLSRRGNHQVARHTVPTLAAGIRFRGIESLTRREIEVAEFASRGYTDSEIANQLGISQRTVESHLAHVYGKLGVTSRRALIRMSSRLAAQSGHQGSPAGASEPVQRVVHRPSPK